MVSLCLTLWHPSSSSTGLTPKQHKCSHLPMRWLTFGSISPVSQTTKHQIFRENENERWCNRVAAELLVPSQLIREEFKPTTELLSEVNRLAGHFKVSSMVILRRLLDELMLEKDEFWAAWRLTIEGLPKRKKDGGGDFFHNVGPKSSKRFARAIVISTKEGRTTYTEAMRLLSMRKVSTFKNYAHTLGVENVNGISLDSNTFIHAQNAHYGFDFCPAFWEWLIKENEARRLYSIDQVRKELINEKKDDLLLQWAKTRSKGFFLSPDEATTASFSVVSSWVREQRVADRYTLAAESEFLKWQTFISLHKRMLQITQLLHTKSVPHHQTLLKFRMHAMG